MNHQRLSFRSLLLGLALITAIALVLKTVLRTMMLWGDYLPPNFNSDFLHGRENYFYGLYQIAFYAHIFSGPFSLLAGLILLSSSIRRRYPAFHRRLGRLQMICVLLLVAPSGLWMAGYAEAGTIASVAFALLALATAFTAYRGWQYALHVNYLQHALWMSRCYVLLCSAVVLRIVGGVQSLIGFYAGWVDSFTAFACWVLPLAAFEWLRRARTSNARTSNQCI